jgi:hypothetical protein
VFLPGPSRPAGPGAVRRDPGLERARAAAVPAPPAIPSGGHGVKVLGRDQVDGLPYRQMISANRVEPMEIPELGLMTTDLELGWHISAERPIRALGALPRRVIVSGYDDDPAKEEIHAAIRDFLALDGSVLQAAAPSIFEYYQDVVAGWGPGDPRYVKIPSPAEIWRHIHIGTDVMVVRNPSHDRRVYVSIECECDWEPEHGLQIVFREGQVVSKVGPYNGHVTNAAAYARYDLADVVYVRTR